MDEDCSCTFLAPHRHGAEACLILGHFRPLHLLGLVLWCWSGLGEMAGVYRTVSKWGIFSRLVLAKSASVLLVAPGFPCGGVFLYSYSQWSPELPEREVATSPLVLSIDSSPRCRMASEHLSFLFFVLFSVEPWEPPKFFTPFLSCGTEMEKGLHPSFTQ